MQKTILITGASSGLGKALALSYAQNGVTLILLARSKNKLVEVQTSCVNQGAKVYLKALDVTKAEAMTNFITEACMQHNVDLVIANAGISAGTLNAPESEAQVRKIFDTNLNGVLNTILPAIPFMIKKRSGQIAIIGSMAGIMGLASAPAYSASKAALENYANGMRAYLKKFNVHLSIVIPGYIATGMTQVNDFPMPLMISAERAAKLIKNGLAAKKGMIIFPKILYYFIRLISILPYGLRDLIIAKLPGKPAFHEITEEENP